MIIGLIPAWNEEANIAAAIASLYSAGCGRVLVVDGAWSNPDGTPFGGGEWYSTDGTYEEARGAGAEFKQAPEGLNDGGKRDWMIRNAGPAVGDHFLLIDADERVHGRVTDAPAGHGCVVLRNDKPNDLEERTRWLDPDHRSSVPLLRWLRWSPTLRCIAPGRYEENRRPVMAYLTEALAARADSADSVERAALAALRSVEFDLPNEHLSVLAIVQGIEISHCVLADDERVAAKRAYYLPEPVPV